MSPAWHRLEKEKLSNLIEFIGVFYRTL